MTGRVELGREGRKNMSCIGNGECVLEMMRVDWRRRGLGMWRKVGEVCSPACASSKTGVRRGGVRKVTIGCIGETQSLGVGRLLGKVARRKGKKLIRRVGKEKR